MGDKLQEILYLNTNKNPVAWGGLVISKLADDRALKVN